MTQKKNRKSLDDILAQQFIYGEKQQDTLKESVLEQTPSEPSPVQPSPKNSKSVAARNAASRSSQATEKISTSNSVSGATPEELEGAQAGVTEKKSNQSPLIDKFQTPPKEATIRFTVDLPQSMHRKLSILAARTGKKKAEIVRFLLDEVLNSLND